MIFLLSLTTTKKRKHMGVVKLCWNVFLSKSNNNKKRGNGWELSNYVGMNFLAKQTIKM